MRWFVVCGLWFVVCGLWILSMHFISSRNPRANLGGSLLQSAKISGICGQISLPLITQIHADKKLAQSETKN